MKVLLCVEFCWIIIPTWNFELFQYKSPPNISACASMFQPSQQKAALWWLINQTHSTKIHICTRVEDSCYPFLSTKASCICRKSIYYSMPSSRRESEQWCQSIPWCHHNSQRITVSAMWSKAKFNTFPLGYFTVWETEARSEVRSLYNFVSHSPDTLILEAGGRRQPVEEKSPDHLLKMNSSASMHKWLHHINS